MAKLKQEGRKQQAQIAKMETMHAKQQNVMKRWMEEASMKATRLQELIDRQNNIGSISKGETAESSAASKEIDSNKVKLIKLMKEDAEKNRAWKQAKEKEVTQLKQEGRKQQVQIAEMETMHVKQQNVMRQKMEEASMKATRLQVGRLEATNEF